MTAQTKDSVDDVDLYLEHANNSVHMLLVTNYKEMEDEVDGVLANLTERVDAVVGGLKNVRQTLEEVGEDIEELEVKKNQLKDGLEESRSSLKNMLALCKNNEACTNFSRDSGLEENLTSSLDFPGLSGTFQEFSFEEAKIEITNVSAKINEFVEYLEAASAAAGPLVGNEMRKNGEELRRAALEVSAMLDEVPISSARASLPKLDDFASTWGGFFFNLGLGIAFAILLILICFILGLFRDCFNRVSSKFLFILKFMGPFIRAVAPPCSPPAATWSSSSPSPSSSSPPSNSFSAPASTTACATPSSILRVPTYSRSSTEPSSPRN